MVAVNRFCGGIFLSKKITVIAGDRRMVTLSNALASLSYDVTSYGHDKVEIDQTVRRENNIFDAVCDADAVVLPVPVSKDCDTVYSPLSQTEIKLSDLMQCIDKKTLVFVPKIIDQIRSFDLKYINYMKDNSLILQNARLTAEATLCELIKNTEKSLLNEKILVIGNGNVGKAVSLTLKKFGADVTVSARKEYDFAYISNMGLKVANTEKIHKIIGNYSFVINTVPALVIGEKELKKIQKGALIIDLASKPGGVDYCAAEQIGVDARLLLGLPGKYMPITAGRILANTVLRLMGEDAQCKI